MLHDESTFRCGEQLTKRWFKKGMNHLLVREGEKWFQMVSDFLVSHPSSPFFNLNETEWSECIEVYSEIQEYTGINFIERTCTGSIQPGQDNYFKCETVLNQFERLFIRKRTDQTYIRLISLLNESRTHFIQNNLANKLLLRFWNCLHCYKNKKSYSEIIIQYFSGKSKGKNESHTKVSKSQICLS
jgi:hypothetical protein